MKPLSHSAVMERVCNGNDDHRLVMRRVSADHGNLHAFREARARKIERLNPSVLASCTELCEMPEVADHRRGIDHGSEAARIRRNNNILVQAPFVSEIGDSEARILIGLFDVAHVVFGLRYAPRETQAIRIFFLPAYN